MGKVVSFFIGHKSCPNCGKNQFLVPPEYTQPPRYTPPKGANAALKKKLKAEYERAAKVHKEYRDKVEAMLLCEYCDTDMGKGEKLLPDQELIFAETNAMKFSVG